MEYKEGMRVEFKRGKGGFVAHHERRFGVIDRITQYLIYVVGKGGRAIVLLGEAQYWLMPVTIERKRNS